MTVVRDWTKHRRVAEIIAREFYFPGQDHNDVEQEALIGLWIAARTFDGQGRFVAWANIVIRRRLITMMNKALTPKYRLLTDAGREEFVLAAGGVEPERIAIDRERLARVTAALDGLSAKERRAVAAHLNGAPSKMTRSHDSALTRARRKLEEVAAQ